MDIENVEWLIGICVAFLGGVVVPILIRVVNSYKSTQQAQWREIDEVKEEALNRPTMDQVKTLVRHKNAKLKLEIENNFLKDKMND